MFGPALRAEERKVNLKPFDGLGSMSIDEFFSRFEKLCTDRGWTTPDDKANRLIQFTTGKSFELLSRVPTFSADAGIDRYQLLKNELREAYGLPIEKAIVSLRARVLRQSENIFDFASDLRNYVTTVLPDLSEPERSQVAAIFFWPGIKQTEAVKLSDGRATVIQLFQGLRQSLEGTSSLSREGPAARTFHATAVFHAEIRA